MLVKHEEHYTIVYQDPDDSLEFPYGKYPDTKITCTGSPDNHKMTMKLKKIEGTKDHLIAYLKFLSYELKNFAPNESESTKGNPEF